MTGVETINLAALITSPIAAVLITLWWQGRKEQRDAKRRLFLTLMAHRRANPPTVEWVNALNVIDVVFADHVQVVQLWHEYYAGLANPPSNQNYESREHTYLLMLSAMARSLGYTRLEQTDIDKYYSPQSHANIARMNFEIQIEWLRILRSTNKLNMDTLPPAPSTEPPAST